MTISTPGLQLKEISEFDIPNIHLLHSLPEIDQFNTLGIPDSIEETKNLVNEWLVQNQVPRSSYIFCIFLKDTDQFIGLIALKLGKPKYFTGEVWYKLHRDHWNKGYTTEALNALLHFGFDELKLHRIEAGCAVDNIASIRVMEKVGMLREGRTRKKLPVRGEWLDNYFYAILEEDFYNSAK